MRHIKELQVLLQNVFSQNHFITAFNESQPGDAIFIARLGGDQFSQRPYTGE